MFYPIVGQIDGANRKINTRCADQRLNISRFEGQGPFKEAARLCHVFAGQPLIQPSPTLENQIHRVWMQ